MSVAQIRRHEQSLHASTRRINDDLRQLMLTYNQQRAEVVKELHHMRRELRQHQQQASTGIPSHTGAHPPLHLAQVAADSDEESTDMQYLKSPYRFDKSKSQRRSNGDNNTHTGTNKLHQPAIPPLVVNAHKGKKRHKDSTNMQMKNRVNKLPALIMGDPLAKNPAATSPSRKVRHKKIKQHGDDVSRPVEQTRELSREQPREQNNTGLTTEQERILARITEKKAARDHTGKYHVTYHLPALDPSAEQRVIYNKPTETVTGKMTWNGHSGKRGQQRYRGGHTIRATMLPPLIEAPQGSDTSIKPASKSASTTTSAMINNSDSLPTNTHIAGQGLSSSSNPSTAESPGVTSEATATTASPDTKHRAIIKTQKHRRKSKTSTVEGVGEKKIVRFAPDVKDYNRESKGKYRRNNSMRVMELVVHCHNNEPMDLPSVVEKYMLRSVPKINV